mmetsp:Transcript_14667/g.29461  ORF Transcript_14667/g.29461 Transcript_14667/m.29461 type:complete len:371 (-) Transcript_14667:520-1632(-)
MPRAGRTRWRFVFGEGGKPRFGGGRWQRKKKEKTTEGMMEEAAVQMVVAMARWKRWSTNITMTTEMTTETTPTTVITTAKTNSTTNATTTKATSRPKGSQTATMPTEETISFRRRNALCVPYECSVPIFPAATSIAERFHPPLAPSKHPRPPLFPSSPPFPRPFPPLSSRISPATIAGPPFSASRPFPHSWESSSSRRWPFEARPSRWPFGAEGKVDGGNGLEMAAVALAIRRNAMRRDGRKEVSWAHVARMATRTSHSTRITTTTTTATATATATATITSKRKKTEASWIWTPINSNSHRPLPTERANITPRPSRRSRKFEFSLPPLRWPRSKARGIGCARKPIGSEADLVVVLLVVVQSLPNPPSEPR